MASNLKNKKPTVFAILMLLWAFILGIPHILAALFYIFFPRPQKNIKNDIVLVTGSGQGLGRELALLFSQQGCEVVCVDLIPEPNLETVKRIQAQGGKARAYICNVADREAVMKLGKAVGRVDILVNNAGIYPFKSLWNSSEEDMRTVIDVNLFSQFWTVQAFLPGMKERNHGHVVCISSISALLGLGYVVPYAVSKFGVAGLMASLSQELNTEKKNIKLTTVYPYFINTRPEIVECTNIPIPAISKKTAATTILRGVLEDQDSFTVPRYMGHLVTLTKILPKACEKIAFDYLPITLYAPKHDEFQERLENGIWKKSGSLKVQKACLDKD